MFGSPEAYNSNVPVNERMMQELRRRDAEYQAAVEKARREGKIVHGDSTFKKVNDADSPSGSRLVRTGSIDQPKYEGPKRKIGKIAAELESQLKERTVPGQLPANYKDTEQKAGKTAENYRSGAGFGSQQLDRTVTSPNTRNMPKSWAEYEEFLNSKQIYLQNSPKKPGTFQSINLATQIEGFGDQLGDEQTSAMFDRINGAKVEEFDLTRPRVKAAGTGYADKYREMASGMDFQSGASDKPSLLDQSRATQAGLTAENGGAGEAPKLSGLSARSRAFLDAPLGIGPAELMRRTNAAQNILQQGNKYAVKGADGAYTEITKEGYDKIRDQKRNQTEFSQDFLKNYLVNAAKPADAQSDHSISPLPVSRDVDMQADPMIEKAAPFYANAFELPQQSDYKNYDFHSSFVEDPTTSTDLKSLMRYGIRYK